MRSVSARDDERQDLKEGSEWKSRRLAELPASLDGAFGGESAPFLIANTQRVFPAKLKEGRTLEDKEKWKKMKGKTAGRKWGGAVCPSFHLVKKGA